MVERASHDTRKSIIFKLGIGFLIIMALFTVFSRAVLNLLTPKVLIARPVSQTVIDNIYADPEISDQNGVALITALIPPEEKEKLYIGQYCEFQTTEIGRAHV